MYSRCWLGTLKWLDNHSTYSGKCQLSDSFFNLLILIKSIVNRNFPYFFVRCVKEYVVFIVPIWSFYQGTTSALSTTTPTSTEPEVIGIFFFSFANCSFLCR